MKIVLNGEPTEVSARDIRDLVETLSLPAPALLIEHNGLALRRDEWPTRELAEGDRVEIVRIVAGG